MYNAKYAAKKDALEGQHIDGLITKHSYYDLGDQLGQWWMQQGIFRRGAGRAAVYETSELIAIHYYAVIDVHLVLS